MRNQSFSTLMSLKLFCAQNIIWLCNEYLERRQCSQSLLHLHFANGNLLVWPLFFTILTGFNYAVCCLRSPLLKNCPQNWQNLFLLRFTWYQISSCGSHNQISNTVKLLFFDHTKRDVMASWFYTSTWHVIIICCRMV